MVLPKPMRIKGHRPFYYLHKAGTIFHSQSMLLKVATAKPRLLSPKDSDNQSNSCRCAISISCKVSKKAVIRNRFRRLLHYHLRQRLESRKEHSNKWALITLKQNSISKEDMRLLVECDQLLKKAGLY